jgi:hypothetical protein
MHEATRPTNVITAVTSVLSLPSTLLLFYNGRVVIGVLVLLLAAVIIASAYGYRWYVNQPSVTLVNHEKTLTFEDKDAHKAVQVSKMRVRANHKGVQRFRIGALGSDGTIGKILIDGKEPSSTRVVAAMQEVYKVFDSPLARGEERDVTGSAEFFDSFQPGTARWINGVGLKTRRLHMKVVFHPERICKDIRAYVLYSGEVDDWITEPLKVSADRREAELEVLKPKRGAEYSLEWDW